MDISRRKALMSALFGAGYVGLRVARDRPARRCAAERGRKRSPRATCADPGKAQFIILDTSGNGDPINANCPGTYVDPKIVHSRGPGDGADRHDDRRQGLHGRVAVDDAAAGRPRPHVLLAPDDEHAGPPEGARGARLYGADRTGTRCCRRCSSKQLAPCLGTIQPQPITLGRDHAERGPQLRGPGAADHPAARAQGDADQPGRPADQPADAARPDAGAARRHLPQQGARQAQQAYLDSIVTSQSRSATSGRTCSARSTRSPTTAIGVADHRGGDADPDEGHPGRRRSTSRSAATTTTTPALATEAAETVSGVAAIASLMSQLAAAGLQDQVTFMSLNVFGRTIGPGNTDGRQHNENHQVSLTIGKPFKGGVIGGVAPVGNDYGCTSIDSTGRLPAATSRPPTRWRRSARPRSPRSASTTA